LHRDLKPSLHATSRSRLASHERHVRVPTSNAAASRTTPVPHGTRSRYSLASSQVTFLLRYAMVHCLGHPLTHELIDPPLTTRDIGRQRRYAILAHGEGDGRQCRRANPASNIRTPTSHHVYQYQYQYLPPRSGAKLERSSRSSAGPASDRGTTACPR
jgi:hypothetical protein